MTAGFSLDSVSLGSISSAKGNIMPAPTAAASSAANMPSPASAQASGGGGASVGAIIGAIVGGLAGLVLIGEQSFLRS